MAVRRAADPASLESLYATQTAVVPEVLSADIGVWGAAHGRRAGTWSLVLVTGAGAVLATCRVLTGLSTVSSALFGLVLDVGWGLLVLAAAQHREEVRVRD